MRLQYVDLTREWQRGLREAFNSPECQEQVVRQIISIQFSRPNLLQVRPAFAAPPADWRWSLCDWSDWRGLGRPGRKPDWWKHFGDGCCHWQVHSNLIAARLWEPGTPWQIAKSSNHSTIIDFTTGRVFDPQYLALGVSMETLIESVLHSDPQILTPNFKHQYAGRHRGDDVDIWMNRRLREGFKEGMKRGRRVGCERTIAAAEFLGLDT